ncbi:MAG: adenylyltransferase/cytidyltransferase family protein [Opitutales bacterium]|nr:adenylyltransferase/cytidyltransferase family protein [Opitutales bacterium]
MEFTPPIHLVIGNFDGVHVGHQTLIRMACNQAHALGQSVVVYTFNPHPRQIIPEAPKLQLIYSVQERCTLLRQLGCDSIWVQTFTNQLRLQTPEQFLQAIQQVFPTLAAVYVGDQFRFGYRQQGDVHTLQDLCEQTKNVRLCVCPSVFDAAGRICSTRIRAALQQGQLSEANRLLGQPYHRYGKVVSDGSNGYAFVLGNPEGEPTGEVPTNGCLLKAGSYVGHFDCQQQQMRVRIQVHSDQRIGLLDCNPVNLNSLGVLVFDDSQ